MKQRNDSPLPSEQADLEKEVESLRRAIRKLQLEHEILKKANELLKKGVGVNPHLLTNREKPLLIDALKQTYALSELLSKLGLARSSYFYHRARLRVSDKFANVRVAVANLFKRRFQKNVKGAVNFMGVLLTLVIVTTRSRNGQANH